VNIEEIEMLLHYVVTFLCLFSCAAGFLDDLFKPSSLRIEFEFDLQSNGVHEEEAITDCTITLWNPRRYLGTGLEVHTFHAGIRDGYEVTLNIDVADWIFLRMASGCEDPAWIDQIKYDILEYGYNTWKNFGRNDHGGWCLSSNANDYQGTSFDDRTPARRCFQILAFSPLQRAIKGGSTPVYGFNSDADWFAYNFPLWPNNGAPTRWGRRSLEEQGAELLGTIEEEMSEPTTQEPLGTIENEMFQHIIPLTASDDAIMHVGAVKALMEFELCEAKKEDCELKLNKVIEMAMSGSEPIPMGSNEVLENTPLDVDLTKDVREGRRKL